MKCHEPIIYWEFFNKHHIFSSSRLYKRIFSRNFINFSLYGRNAIFPLTTSTSCARVNDSIGFFVFLITTKFREKKIDTGKYCLSKNTDWFFGLCVPFSGWKITAVSRSVVNGDAIRSTQCKCVSSWILMFPHKPKIYTYPYNVHLPEVRVYSAQAHCILYL